MKFYLHIVDKEVYGPAKTENVTCKSLEMKHQFFNSGNIQKYRKKGHLITDSTRPIHNDLHVNSFRYGKNG